MDFDYRTDVENIPYDVDIIVRLSNGKYHIGNKHENVFIIGNRFSFDLDPITHWRILDKI